jgi:NAD kinase
MTGTGDSSASVITETVPFLMSYMTTVRPDNMKITICTKQKYELANLCIGRSNR